MDSVNKNGGVSHSIPKKKTDIGGRFVYESSFVSLSQIYAPPTNAILAVKRGFFIFF
jgi:hypothetical protein